MATRLDLAGPVLVNLGQQLRAPGVVLVRAHKLNRCRSPSNLAVVIALFRSTDASCGGADAFRRLNQP